ncbi:MAG: carbohydrate-binding family 9-like protein [Candidatus Poribacteria bacterium]|nr:carbohydrate-binding family 9-like protein [Candidatus Poribacteria bacterium]
MPDLPQYDCIRIDGEIAIDGTLADAAWAVAHVVELAKTDTGTKPEQPTQVRLLWSNQYLYIGFLCHDRDVWGTVREHDGPLYNEEVVEVFLDPDGDLRTYIEIEVNPLNALFDAFVINGKDRGQGIHILRDWDSHDLQHAVSIDGVVKTSPPKERDPPVNPPDRSWSCEIAIPFKDLLTAPNIPPKAGDVWRLNLYRIDRGKTEDADEYSAWSPTWKIDYHRPQYFGCLRFVEHTE